jgi:dihydrolipoamide dehydrogenase
MYDLIVVGAGPAGHTAALEAANSRLKVLLIEKEKSRIGGCCLNEGCIPLKGMLYHSSRERDYRSIKERVSERVGLLRSGLYSRMQKSGVDIVFGEARFVSGHDIECDGAVYKGDKFIIAAGSSPRRLYAGENIFSPEKIFDLDTVPSKALIIGGGAIGCEYASLLDNFGAEVDIAEIRPSILPGYDEESVRTLSREFRKRKIMLREGCSIKDVSCSGEVTFNSTCDCSTGVYDLIIEATGRVPNTSLLKLERAGVAADNDGFILVDGFMMTSNPDVFACGDCVRSPMLANVASREASLAVARICGRKTEPIDYSKIPSAVFSSPQIASVGMNQNDAVAEGVNVRTKKYYFKALGKPFIEERESGFIKLVIDASADSIIGAVAVGEDAVEIMNELSLVINCGIPNRGILEAAHIHPSYGEIIAECLRYGM